MPISNSIVSIDGYKVKSVEGIDPVMIKVVCTEEARCPFCGGGELRKKSRYERRVRHESFGTRATILVIEAWKYFCKLCTRYFNQRFPGILPRKRSSEIFRKEVFEKHNNGICQSTLSKMLSIGSATIERWYHDFLKLKVSEMKNAHCPRIMGIDEHFFSRKNGYATTICNLGNNKVFDVTLGRTDLSLSSYLKNLRGKENVKVVVMDMAEVYRQAVKKHFPNAKIVSDRFHVIRLINHHFLKLWQQIDPDGRKNRGLLSLMRRHQHNLSPQQKIKLDVYFIHHPELKPIYDFKQKLAALLLLKKQTQRECKKLIPVFLDYIQQLKNSALEQMVTLGKTLESWKEEVVRMWRFTKSNGITEGFHNKMKTIQKRAYGFRNFENYRLRVRALCC